MAARSVIPGHTGHGQHRAEDQITCSCHGVKVTHVPGQWDKLVLHPTAWLCILPTVPWPGAVHQCHSPHWGISWGQHVTPEL